MVACFVFASLFLCGCLVRWRRLLFFSLSLSLRSWGNPNPLWFGFPLVLHRRHNLHPRPVHLVLQLPQGRLPLLCFVFDDVRVEFGVVRNLRKQRRETDKGWLIRRRAPFSLLRFWFRLCFGVSRPYCHVDAVLGCWQLAGCTVMQMPLRFAPVQGGNAVLFLCLVRRPLSVTCSFLFLKVAVWNTLSGANLRFRLFVVVLCFSVVVCLDFRFMVWSFPPKIALKKFSSRQVSFFGSFPLHLRVFVSTTFFARLFVFFSREQAQVVTGHHTPLHVLVLCLFFVSPHLCLCPFWPCVLSFLRFLGVPFWIWTPRVFRILSGLGGLSSFAPSEALFSDARRQGWFLFSLLLSLIFPFVVFAVSRVF